MPSELKAMPEQSKCEQAKSITLNIMGGSLYGACAGLLVANPIGGAIFGATTVASSYVIEPLFDKFFHPESFEGKVAKVAAKCFVAIAIAVAVVSLAGFSLTVIGGIKLALLMGILGLVYYVAKAVYNAAQHLSSKPVNTG